MQIDYQTILALAAELAPKAVAMRRDLHRHPELGHEETRERPIRSSQRSRPTVSALDPGSRARVSPSMLGAGTPYVGFRADIDALPILEMTSVPFRSTVDGVMHACGHDAHTAIGTYAAILLERYGVSTGRIRFIFQPGEGGVSWRRHRDRS